MGQCCWPSQQEALAAHHQDRDTDNLQVFFFFFYVKATEDFVLRSSVERDVFRHTGHTLSPLKSLDCLDSGVNAPTSVKTSRMFVETIFKRSVYCF